MALQIAALNSGSNGNCYYIGNSSEAVLVDAGISCRELEKRMDRLGLAMSLVKAIFISHEHVDHITGLPGISKKYNLPVYITTSTYQHSHCRVSPELVFHFHPDTPVQLGSLKIYSFAKSHDAIDPHSFFISHQGTNVGVFTDIGYACETLIQYFRHCHAAFLETNYCEKMLTEGNYPWHLKQRIRGNKGHLSNRQAHDLFLNHAGPGLSHLILSHLSQNNNCPDVVMNMFSGSAGSTHITVASRYSETNLFTVDHNGHRLPQPVIAPIRKSARPSQLSLF